nr:hypothetical protein [Tanacetum cinerariifolium]
MGDTYGNHAILCAGIIGIEHRHNAMRDTSANICFRSGISAGKEVNIGLGGGCDKALRPADMLLYSWDSGFDVCVDLTGSSPLTRTEMADFVPGRAVIDAAQRKRACSKVFMGDTYGNHAVLCAGIIGIEHRHNAMRDTSADICFRSGISAGKEVNIGLGGGCDKALRPADMLLYSWDSGFDVCVDLTGSSPLTRTGMADFVPGRAVIDAAQRKRGIMPKET